MTALELAFGLQFTDLYRRDGLLAVDRAFCDRLAETDPDLSRKLRAARRHADSLSPRERSALMLDLTVPLERFLVDLFGIADEFAALVEQHAALAPVFRVKRNFVQRRAIKGMKPEALADLDITPLIERLEAALGGPITDLGFAELVERLQQDAEADADLLETARTYAAWAALSEDGRARHGGDVLFRAPGKFDPERLFEPFMTRDGDDMVSYARPDDSLRPRDGFQLTDRGTDLKGALDQANYCIWCHKQGKDSCSKGLKPRRPAEGEEDFLINDCGVRLAGCPLEERISEFQLAKAEGRPIGALAIVAVDNPMVAATGHRICNDCMKSCIYQRQDPVNIPQVETRMLKDVLGLPWGFEIYSLLTRWNPLDFESPLPAAPSGRKVLVVGMGPAGYTLAHHLLNAGHAVVGIDGLKIEPLASDLSGVAADGSRVPFRPIRDFSELVEPLDDRVLAGFGGVAEYGITVRWDKNYLKAVRLLLERRSEFALFGGVRFGSTLTPEQAWSEGFDHIALAAGAGKPTLLDIPNGLARGVRTASDFLMGLQLTGAAKRDSVANLQLRLPILVIGGGLTAIDTATESLAYYTRQVEKFRDRYMVLAAEIGEEELRRDWSREETEIADEWLAHGEALAGERAAAATAGRPPRFAPLLRQWGGATIVYRKRLVDSPAFRLNHEEIEKALEEGIAFREGLSPKRIEIDAYGHTRALVAERSLAGSDEQRSAKGGEVVLAARSVFIAAGTRPNTVLAREMPGLFDLDGQYFQACDEAGRPVAPAWANAKPDRPEILLKRTADNRFLSFFGDLHPSYFGNVVKAMASAKQGFPRIEAVLSRTPPASPEPAARLFERLNGMLRPRVVSLQRLTPNIVEVVLEAPAAARNFRPGQFFRLQNFETNALRRAGTTLAMEGIALTGAWVDPRKGLISLIVLEMGGSTNLCRLLHEGERVVLMGPTGAPTLTPSGETVMLVGGGLGNAVLFSIGQALRENGSRVLYFAGYKKREDVYKMDEIEAASDVVVWCCDEPEVPTPRRPQDRSINANIVEAIRAYGEGRLGEAAIPVESVERMIVIGSDRMMAAVAAARRNGLAAHLRNCRVAIGSINSPMQCMMKEICAQCLQPHVDPQGGARSVVFSCFEQDQPLDRVDWHALRQRLAQNSLAEKLTAKWIAHCLAAGRTAAG